MYPFTLRDILEFVQGITVEFEYQERRLQSKGCMLSSHFMPDQTEMALALSNEAVTNHLQLNKKTVELIAGASGPFALIAHEAYFFERLQDIRTIIARLKSERQLITGLSIKEEELRPKKRIYKKTLSKPLQKTWQKGQEVHQQMKLDMESLYIFGNLLLDQWAHIVGYMTNDLDPKKYSFAAFVDKVQKKGDKGAVEPFWAKHRQDILWLFYQLRMYRNVFIEHMRVPRQRGTNRSTNGHDFRLFTPTSYGWLEESQIEEKVRSIYHLAPPYVRLAPARIWQAGNMRNLLEEIFYNIDQIEEQADREKVWNVWNEVGGATPSYDVIAMRLMRFTASSLLTIIELISLHPENVNLGKQQTAQVL